MAATVASGSQNQYATTTSGGTVPSDLFIRDVPDWIDLIERQDVPLQKMFGTAPAPTMPMLKSEWGWGAPDPYTTTLAVSCGSGDLTIQVADGSYFAVADTIFIDDEMLRVTGIANDTLTVERGVGGTSAASHTGSVTPANAAIIAIGSPALVESADDPDSPFTMGQVDYNYPQIMSFTWSMSQRRKVTPTYEGKSKDNAQRELRKKMEYTAPLRFEISLILGRRQQGSGSTPSTMGGLREPTFITNRLNLASAPFTETDLMNGLETVNTVVGSTSTPDTIIGSPFMMRAISSWYNETRRSGMGDSKASVKWTEIETWSGTVKLVSHYLFAKLPGMNGRIYAMDPSKIKRRPYASDTGWNTGQYETQGWHTRGYLRGDFTSLWPEADTRIEWRNASTTSSDYAGFS